MDALGARPSGIFLPEPPPHGPKVRSGKCLDCPAIIMIQGRGKFPLRCSSCNVERRRESNRVSQRRFKAKVRHKRSLERDPPRIVRETPHLSSRCREDSLAGSDFARTRRLSKSSRCLPRSRVSSQVRTSLRQSVTPLLGEVFPGVVVRTEWEERFDAAESIFIALGEARVREREAQCLLNLEFSLGCNSQTDVIEFLCRCCTWCCALDNSPA